MGSKGKSKKRVHPLVTSTAQAFAHQNTTVVARHRALKEFEREQCEDAINALEAELARQRKRRQDLDAQITGLTLVVERRQCTFGVTPEI